MEIITKFIIIVDMRIEENKYLLSDTNFVQNETEKTQIILSNSFNHDMRHVIGWRNRLNGEYTKTAAFTIDVAGVIHKHFNPIYYSNYLENQTLDKKSIVILIENDGWLQLNEKNKFVNWFGDIYKHQTKVFTKKWRNKEYWSIYNKKQLKSAIELTKKLCLDFNIPLNVMEHNVKVNSIEEFNGVCYKGNLEKHYIDLNPSWDYQEFKKNVEDERQN